MSVSVVEAAQALVAKLDEVNAATLGVFVLAKVHGMEYNGPNYGAELESLRNALAGASPLEETTDE